MSALSHLAAVNTLFSLQIRRSRPCRSWRLPCAKRSYTLLHAQCDFLRSKGKYGLTWEKLADLFIDLGQYNSVYNSPLLEDFNLNERRKALHPTPWIEIKGDKDGGVLSLRPRHPLPSSLPPTWRLLSLWSSVGCGSWTFRFEVPLSRACSTTTTTVANNHHCAAR
jgi:hypothetical protein